MAKVEDIYSSLDEMGYTIEDPKVADRMAALCDMYNIDEEKIACEYMAYASNKKLGCSPTMAIVETFASERLDRIAEQIKKNAKNKILDSTTIGSVACEVSGMDIDDEDAEILSKYGTPQNKNLMASKRQITPEGNHSPKRRVNMNQTFSPESFKPDTPSSQGGSGKYATRTNSGQVLIKFGDPVSKEQWATSSNYTPTTIKDYDGKRHFPKDYRFMFERLREKAGYLDEVICRIGDVLTSKHDLEEAVGFTQTPMTETFPTLGRICCDSEGRLNASSLMLQGTQDLSRGRSIAIDTSQVKEFTLFPGQIVQADVTNPTGSRLIASKLTYDASPAMASMNKTGLRDGDTMNVVVACGPYTTADDLDYQPFKDLMEYIEANKPGLVILCGPFVDCKHAKIEQCDTNGETFEEIFTKLMVALKETLARLGDKTVVICQPSSRDVHHKFVYPTPAFDKSHDTDKIKMVPDPALISVDGIVFGLTSTDILFHLGKEEISYPPRSGDRLRRLVNHLLQQQSFYPLFPPSEDVNIDLEQLENVGSLPVQPHVLVTPSDLLHFFKDVNGGLVMNPHRLTKGSGGGVFARLAIRGKAGDGVPFTKRVSAEIVRI